MSRHTRATRRCVPRQREGLLDQLPEAVLVRCEDCDWSEWMPLAVAAALVQAHPDGLKGTCRCAL